MPSSTSSSSLNRITRPTLVLLVGVVLYAAGVELVTRQVLAPASRIQRTCDQEMSATKALRAAAPGQPKSVLIVGNSLLDAAVEFPKLAQNLGPDWQASRLMIADTSYVDWRFGLLRLLNGGARPEAIAVVLSPMQLTRNTVRGGIFAHYLMRSEDLTDVARRVHMHPTEASGLLLARYSLFYGIRAPLRNVILGHLFPDLPSLFKAPPSKDAAPFNTQMIRRETEVRLRELDSIARRYGIRLAFVLPPLPGDDFGNGIATTMESGSRTGVTVLQPMPAGELPPTAFPDGLHANKQGAEAYTSRLGPSLRQWLDSAPADISPRAPAPR